MAKTTCPVTKDEFQEKAQPVKVEVGGVAMMAEPKQFSTGTFGWYLSGKAPLTVDGKTVTVQIGANLVVIGSKEAK
jgi:hypothetical protein